MKKTSHHPTTDNDDDTSTTTTVTTAVAATRSTNDDNNFQRERSTVTSKDDQIIIEIEANLRNMGKSLSCPLCLSTLRKPVILPCLHAFCQECIQTHISNTIQQQHKRQQKNQKPAKKSNMSCPICKESCTKRSMVRSLQLEELARKYKETIRSFGFTPVIYDKSQNVGMTQIEEEVSFSIEESSVVGSPSPSNYFHHDHDPNQKRKATTTTTTTTATTNQQDGGTNNQNKSQTKKGRKSKRKQNQIERENNEEELESQWLFKKNKKTTPPTVRECHEHLEVSRAVHNALKRVMDENQENGGTNTSTSPDTNVRKSNESTTETDSSPTNHDKDNDNHTTITESTTRSKSSSSSKNHKMTMQEMERQNQRKKLQTLLNDQEKVVKVDEAAIVKAASYTYKKRKSLDEKKKDESQENTGSVDNDHSGCGSNNNGRSGGNSEILQDKENGSNYSKEMEGMIVPKLSNDRNHSYTTIISDITTTNNTTLQTSTTIHEQDQDIPQEQQLQQHPEQSPSTTNLLKRAEEAISNGEKLLDLPLTQTQAFFSATAEENEEENHQELAVKEDVSTKKENIMTSQETYEASMDEIRENDVVDQSMEEIIEDNTNPNTNQALNSERIQNQQQKENQTTSQVSEKYFSASSQHRGDNMMDIDAKNDDKEKSTLFTVGTIVNVQARTWPGVNKPGGTARITKVHLQSSTNNVQYNVTYILGGKEKMVDEAFISLPKDDNEDEDEKSYTEKSIEIESTSVASRKSRRVGKRKKVERWVEKIDAELEQKELEEKKSQRDPRSQRSSTKSKEDEVDPKGSTNSNSETTKKRKRSTDSTNEEETLSSTTGKSSSKLESLKKGRKSAKTQVKTVTNPKRNVLAPSQLKDLAMKRYRNILFGDNIKAINITTSSLSEENEKLVKQFCSKFSGKNGM